MRELSSFMKIFRLFEKRQKTNAVILLGLTVIGAIAETFSIGVILPFMYLILNPKTIQEYPVLQRIYDLSFVGSYNRFVVLMCTALALVFVLKSLYMFFLIYIQNRLSFNRQVAISRELFRSYITKPYTFFFDHNSAEMQRNINVLVPNAINGVFLAGLTLITEGLIIIFIVIFLFVVSSISATVVIFAIGGISFVFYLRLKTTLDKTAKRERKYGNVMVKAVNEGLGSIKEIKILGRTQTFVEDYEDNSKSYANARAISNLLTQTPRLLIEAITVLGIIVIVIVNLLSGRSVEAIIPTLAIFGMSAFRVMPSMNRVLANLTSIRYSAVSLDAFYVDLVQARDEEEKQDKPNQNRSVDQSVTKDINTMAHQSMEADLNGNIENEGDFKFCQEIKLTDVSYRYPNTPEDVLSHVNMSIKKGTSVGIVGPSGAGKTTLIDLILGLISPTFGEISIDQSPIEEVMAGFRRDIGYVPQSIFLIDDTIERNVAFGIPESEKSLDKVWKALEIAHMKDYVESLPEGLETNIGETGIKLSGGQRQRLGIARAVYHNPQVLIFDEATSSLDIEIEKTISDAISDIGKTKTVIIIAHRLNTLESCDEIYEVRGKTLSLKERRE